MRNRLGRISTIVETKLNSIKQNLPLELDTFWSFSNNKRRLLKVFITWLCHTYSGEKPVYLAGAISNITTSYAKVCGGHTCSQGFLKCSQEEADDRMLGRVHHPVRVKNFRRFIVDFSDTDVFVTLI